MQSNPHQVCLFCFVPFTHETNRNQLSAISNCKTEWFVGQFNQYFLFEYSFMVVIYHDRKKQLMELAPCRWN